MKRRPALQILVHAIGCVVFLSLPLIFSPESLSLHSYLTNPPTQRDIIAYVLVLAAFYSNYYFLIPKFYFPRRYLPFSLVNLLIFALVIIMPVITIHFPDQQGFGPVQGFHPGQSFQPGQGIHQGQSFQPGQGFQPGQSFFHPPHPNAFGRRAFLMDITQHLLLFLLALSLALLLKVRDRWKRAEKEKLEAELSYLKAQVNPHFLFNTLNSIYALTLEHSDRASTAIVKLSSMMRYVLLDAGREKVALAQEITYLQDYIQLQQTRFEGSIDVDCTVTGVADDKYIVPLLLIPFVENAFKHGVSPEEPSVIRIHILILEEELQLQVVNNKVAIPQPIPIPSGLGISNTRQRLQYLYPRKHTLFIEDGTTQFSVSLTLKLT